MLFFLIFNLHCTHKTFFNSMAGGSFPCSSGFYKIFVVFVRILHDFQFSKFENSQQEIACFSVWKRIKILRENSIDSENGIEKHAGLYALTHIHSFSLIQSVVVYNGNKLEILYIMEVENAFLKICRICPRRKRIVIMLCNYSKILYKLLHWNGKTKRLRN